MDDVSELTSEYDYVELKRLLKALGDVVRLNMVRVLARSQETTVTDLTEMLVINGRHISQPLVSWHLTILRRVGLVRTRRVGRQVYCSLDMNRYQLCLRMLGNLVAEPPEAGEHIPLVRAAQPDTTAGTLGPSLRRN